MMSSNVDIITNKIESTLYIAREAIRWTDNKSHVVILNDKIPEKVDVETGIQTPIYTEILSGLEPKQEVIIGDWEKLLEEANQSKGKGSALKKILWMIRSK